MAGQIEIIKLIIAYTLVGAFVFTVVATCGSLVGLIKFADNGQQKKLFAVLVVELVVICVGAFANLLNLNPIATANDIQKPLVTEIRGLEVAAVQQSEATSTVANQLNTVALKGLRPEAETAAAALIAAARREGVDLRLWSGYRSPEQQAALYARGRTAPGARVTSAKRSVHTTGLAFDVVIYTNGKPDFDSPNYQRVGAIGKSQGLVWGGDWRTPDYPHFELPNAQRVLAAMK
ncbi:MAG: M15 family metallopeptidase [Caulobacter sp.]|nr:M15 family metallopeptidase [Caulobacter sp.]